MIIGKNIVLEEIDPANIEWMRQQRNSPEMRQYFREWKDISKEQQEKWYKNIGCNTDSKFVYWQIMMLPNVSADDNLFVSEQKIEGLKKDVLGYKQPSKEERIANRQLCGCCNLSYIDWRLRSAEFGLFLDQNLRGLGLGKEALWLMCNFGFNNMNLHKIWCEVFDNNSSINLYRKIGFKDEGLIRDTYFENGKYGNSYLLSVLDNEWFDINKRV